jgi:hypothetical protein
MTFTTCIGRAGFFSPARPFCGAVFLAPRIGPGDAMGICKPVSERTGEVGCWIIAHEPIGQLNQSQMFWHLDVYPTRAAAEAAKGP